MSGIQQITAKFRRLLRGKALVYSIGLLLTLLVCSLHVFPPDSIASLLLRLDNLVYDQRYSIMPKPERDYSNKIVIVDLDERSLQAEGQFPWDRFKMGRLVEQLENYGVLVTGFDITFPEPQRNVVRDILANRDTTDLDPEWTEQLLSMEESLDADRYFANAIASPQMDVVAALSFNPIQNVQYGALPESIVEIDPQLAERLRLPEMAGYTGNIAVIQEAAVGAGIMNQLPDIDGIVRRVPLVVRYNNALYPTLALEMARLYFFEDSFELLTFDNGAEEIMEGIRVGSSAGQYELATDALSQVLVPYVGASVLSGGNFYPYVSATDVLNGTADAEILENSLVLIGTTATGLFDLRATPMEAVYPGVEVHANILNALLKSFVVTEVATGEQGNTEAVFSGFEASAERHFPYKPAWEDGALLIVLVVVGLVLTFLLPHLGPAILVIVTVLLFGSALWFNFMLWSVFKMDISLSLIFTLIGLLTVFNMAYGFLVERLSRKTIKGMFDQYVPPAHIDAMLKNPEDYSFEGESREMTVLFCDIRSFTSISESLTAVELKTLLNDFFTPVTEIIFANNGTIDKYVGDMVMAFWGAPLHDPKHRDNAVQAALQVIAKAENLREEFVQRGFPEVHIGIGINSGVMNVGDMGSVYRRSYTVLGDAVNLSSRLEGLTKYYGVQCLLGEDTHATLNGFLCRLIDKVKVKGKDLPVKAYEPVCLLAYADAELVQKTDAWHAFLALYFERQWDAAEQALIELQSRDPDTQLYGIYQEKIALLRFSNPGSDWDGAFQHESK